MAQALEVQPQADCGRRQRLSPGHRLRKIPGDRRRLSAPSSWWTWPTSPAWWPPGVHQNPVPYADVVTTTTHKTLRGPRGGMILCKEEYAKAIDKAIFPGTQGGPLMHIIAAKAVCLGEALQPEFKAYGSRW